jgi:hypothetical protein
MDPLVVVENYPQGPPCTCKLLPTLAAALWMAFGIV